MSETQQPAPHDELLALAEIANDFSDRPDHTKPPQSHTHHEELERAVDNLTEVASDVSIISGANETDLQIRRRLAEQTLEALRLMDEATSPSERIQRATAFIEQYEALTPEEREDLSLSPAEITLNLLDKYLFAAIRIVAADAHEDDSTTSDRLNQHVREVVGLALQAPNEEKDNATKRIIGRLFKDKHPFADYIFQGTFDAINDVYDRKSAPSLINHLATKVLVEYVGVSDHNTARAMLATNRLEDGFAGDQDLKVVLGSISEALRRPGDIDLMARELGVLRGWFYRSQEFDDTAQVARDNISQELHERLRTNKVRVVATAMTDYNGGLMRDPSAQGVVNVHVGSEDMQSLVGRITTVTERLPPDVAIDEIIIKAHGSPEGFSLGKQMVKPANLNALAAMQALVDAGRISPDCKIVLEACSTGAEDFAVIFAEQAGLIVDAYDYVTYRNIEGRIGTYAVRGALRGLGPPRLMDDALYRRREGMSDEERAATQTWVPLEPSTFYPGGEVVRRKPRIRELRRAIKDKGRI